MGGQRCWCQNEEARTTTNGPPRQIAPSQRQRFIFQLPHEGHDIEAISRPQSGAPGSMPHVGSIWPVQLCAAAQWRGDTSGDEASDLSALETLSKWRKIHEQCELQPAAPCVRVQHRHVAEEVAAPLITGSAHARSSLRCHKPDVRRNLFRSSLGNRPGGVFYGAAHCLSVGLARIDNRLRPEPPRRPRPVRVYVHKPGDSVVRHLEREHPPVR